MQTYIYPTLAAAWWTLTCLHGFKFDLSHLMLFQSYIHPARIRSWSLVIHTVWPEGQTTQVIAEGNRAHALSIRPQGVM